MLGGLRKMRSALYLLIFLITTASASFMSCGADKTSKPEPPNEYSIFLTQLAESPRDNAEAELMALWITGKAVAYRSDYDRIRNSIARVRSEYGDSIPFVDSQQFVYPMSVSKIYVYLTACAIEKFRNGEYHDWDSLNTLYRVSDIVLKSYGLILLSFEPRLNPMLLLESYRDLASITYAEPNFLIGDRPNVYPWFDGDDETFLFRYAWGDCPSGCIHSKFWYFRVVGNTVEYVGVYAPSDGDPIPAWWDEAKIAFYKYHNMHSGYCQ
jgi:hypothetical protein